MGGVLGIAVADVILHRAQIGPLIRKVIAAAVTQHVRPNPAELGLLAGEPDDVIHGLPGDCACRSDAKSQRRLSLRGGEVVLDRAQFIAGDRVLDAEAALEPSDPLAGANDSRRALYRRRWGKICYTRRACLSRLR